MPFNYLPSGRGLVGIHGWATFLGHLLLQPSSLSSVPVHPIGSGTHTFLPEQAEAPVEDLLFSQASSLFGILCLEGDPAHPVLLSPVLGMEPTHIFWASTSSPSFLCSPNSLLPNAGAKMTQI